MIVLSLFDGMACGYEALKRAGIYVEKYYSSEIDKHAIKVAKNRHPDIVHLGDVQNWREWDIKTPDLIIGGSPCQGFSFAGQQLAFDDPRSALFFTMTDIIEHYKQKNPELKYLLENVRMKKEYLDIITDYMGCGEPHFINSALVSAQNRQRYYWYNWDAPDPEDRGILLADIVEDGEVDRDKSYCIDANYYKGGSLKNYLEKKRRQLVMAQSEKRLMVKQEPRGKNKGFEKEMDKSPTITSSSFEQNVKIKGGRVVGRRINPKTGKRDDYNKDIPIAQYVEHREDDKAGCITTVQKDSIVALNEEHWRKLTPVECERLQTLQDGYTEGVSNTQRYRMLGNGWTVEVIVHLFNHMPLRPLEEMLK